MKKLVRQFRLVKAASAGAIALVLAGQAVPSFAQDATSDARLRKMESEIRALQRKVFPGADGKVFQPEITPGASTAAGPGQPATSAVTDLLSRVDVLEAALAKLTGQVEQNSNRIAQLETRLGPAEPAGSAPSVPAPLSAPAPSAVPAPAASTPAPPAGVIAASSLPAAPKPAPKPAAKPAPKPASAGRLEAVRGIEKPQTADAGDDEYSYGFRLWEAKFYPEAQQQLQLYVQKYPKHARISYGRNLLGRAYLDDGNPTEAAKWFLQNYQSDKNGGRAADSLLYLGVSMKQLKDTKRACIALSEFSEVYSAEAAGRLKGTYDATRTGLKCG